MSYLLSNPNGSYELLFSSILKSSLVSFDWPPRNTGLDALIGQPQSHVHSGFGRRVSTTQNAGTERGKHWFFKGTEAGESNRCLQLLIDHESLTNLSTPRPGFSPENEKDVGFITSQDPSTSTFQNSTEFLMRMQGSVFTSQRVIP